MPALSNHEVDNSWLVDESLDLDVELILLQTFFSFQVKGQNGCCGKIHTLLL